MELKSISGIVYLVRDIDKTVKFYEELGFRPGKRTDTGATIYLNWFWVELRQQEGPGEKVIGQSTQVSVANVDEFYEGVKAKGMIPLSKPQDTLSGRREFNLADPDGYQLVFFQKK